MSWYLGVLRKYVIFSGRARRKEYWMFLLINMVFVLIISIIDIMLGTGGKNGGGLLYSIYVLAIFIPGLAVTIRRLHDIGNSGWLCLIALIPFGAIALFIMFMKDGDLNENKYGPNPKQVYY